MLIMQRQQDYVVYVIYIRTETAKAQPTKEGLSKNAVSKCKNLAI